MHKSPDFLTIFGGHTLADLVGSVLFSLGDVVAVLSVVAIVSKIAAWLFVYALKYLGVYRRCYVGWKFYALHKAWIEQDPSRSSWSTYKLRKGEAAE